MRSTENELDLRWQDLIARCLRAGSTPGQRASVTTQPLRKHFGELGLRAALIPVLAILLAFLAGTILIAIAAVSPAKAYASLLHGAFGSKNNLAETLVKMAPLLLAALGIAV